MCHNFVFDAHHIDGLMKDCSNSSAYATESQQVNSTVPVVSPPPHRTKPSTPGIFQWSVNSCLEKFPYLTIWHRWSIRIMWQTPWKVLNALLDQKSTFDNFDECQTWKSRKFYWSSHIFHWSSYIFVSHGLRTGKVCRVWSTFLSIICLKWSCYSTLKKTRK